MPVKIADPKNEYAKDKHLKESDIQILREWLEKQPHLPEILELQLIQFLQSCYFSVEKTKITIDNFYTVRTHFSEAFTNRTLKWAPLQDIANICLFTIMEQKTDAGHAVIFCKILSGDTSTYSFAEHLKLFDMVIMLWLRQNGTAEGLHIVIDLVEFTLGHLAKFGIVAMKKFMFYLQEALPVRLKGMHFIHVVSFMDKIMAMMRPFMKKELMDVLLIHAESIEGLYKFVPKACLPRDLGGDQDSIADLHELMMKNIADNSDYFLADEKEFADESKRPGKPKDAGDIFGVEGTFKKLDID